MKLSEIIEVAVVLIVVIVTANAVVVVVPLSFLKTPIAILLFLILLFSILKLGKTKEGTSQAVERWGGFKKCIMAWKGYKLDKNCNVKKGRALQLPGGLRYIGIRGIDKIHKSHFRFYSVELREGEEPKVQFKDLKDLDYILVKPDTYWSKIVKAETKDGMIVDIEFLDTIRSINPRKTFFVAPPNWLENVLSRLNALRTGWVRSQELDTIRTLREDPKILWEELGKDPLIQKTFKNEWGIQIEKNGMQIYKINLLPEYQAALAREKQMDLETKAKVAVEKIEREAEKIELRHVKDRAKEIVTDLNVKPENALEVVQTERGKVVKTIIEYKGLEGVRGLPLINIGGETIPLRKGPRKKKKKEENTEITEEDIAEMRERIRRGEV